MRINVSVFTLTVVAFLAGCASGSVQNTAACLPSAHMLCGSITDGRPVARVRVVAHDAQANEIASLSDEAGRFALDISQLNLPVSVVAPAMSRAGAPVRLQTIVTRQQLEQHRYVMISPLSTLLVRRAVNDINGAINASTPLDADLALANRTLNQTLSEVLQALGIDSQFDWLTSPAGDMAEPAAHALQLMPIDIERGTIQIGFGRSRQFVEISPMPQPIAAPNADALKSLAQVVKQGTTTPIRHLVVVVGENHTFDNVFGVYRPKQGQTIDNLLSKGIVDEMGRPGPAYGLAVQTQAKTSDQYSISPARSDAYKVLPQPRLTGVYDSTGHPMGRVADQRFPADLPPGPFQATRFVPYHASDSAIGDPVHRFFQMWQQTGGDNSRLDLYTWVATTTGIGGDNKGITPKDAGQGGEVMGFNNMLTGDAPLFKQLADHYAMSDNYHQPIMGGTGANFFSLATGDLPVFLEKGRPAVPHPSQIEDPDPLPGTTNFYKRDGYQGGSYVQCADGNQPGVASIHAFLKRQGLSHACESGHYYLVNNYNAPFDMRGDASDLAPAKFTYPPQTLNSIADVMTAHKVSWKWYTGGRDSEDVMHERLSQLDQYNDTGDPLNSLTNIVRTEQARQLQGLHSFYQDIDHDALPAVSFVVPKNTDSGHPGYSVTVRYEAFLKDLLDRIAQHPDTWAETAIVITTDEGGGSFDSGAIEILDFFGSGPRIPLLIVSPYARKGAVDHLNADHGSILKFIERNWRLPTISPRSRDRLPNPVTLSNSPYKSSNGPAISDLMTMFEF